jgi:HprK-related kinase A
MRYVHRLRIGPAVFRVGSDWPEPIAALRTLYRDYPAPEDGVADYTVRLFAARPWRRWVRPAITLGGDFVLPEAVPLPLAWGLLAAEMGMNLQLALGERRYLLLHAASVEQDGRAIILTGLSGAGKSTLAALLAAGGWRLMGDEFALLDPATGLLHAFPRLVSLKNASVDAVAKAIPGARFGPFMEGTPKGDVRHLVPDAQALAAMDRPARPALVVFPAFGFDRAVRAVPPSEAFVRLTQASTNYTALGERGFAALSTLVTDVPAVAIDYPDAATALEQVAGLWAAL